MYIQYCMFACSPHACVDFLHVICSPNSLKACTCRRNSLGSAFDISTGLKLELNTWAAPENKFHQAVFDVLYLTKKKAFFFFFICTNWCQNVTYSPFKENKCQPWCDWCTLNTVTLSESSKFCVFAVSHVYLVNATAMLSIMLYFIRTIPVTNIQFDALIRAVNQLKYLIAIKFFDFHS